MAALIRKLSVPWELGVCTLKKEEKVLPTVLDSRVGGVRQAAAGSLGPPTSDQWPFWALSGQCQLLDIKSRHFFLSEAPPLRSTLALTLCGAL